MKKLIMGLSCLGVLSAVSCDNESNKKPPALKGVNLSARQTDDGVKQVIQTGTAYVKLTMTTDEAGSTSAKYYKATQDKGSELKNVKFLIQKDGSIDEFFLQASEAGITYWVQQFDLYDKDPYASSDKGTLQYTISKAVELTLQTGGSDNNVTIDVVKNGSEQKGSSTSLKAPSFSTQTVKGYSFTVGFLNASQLWFTKSNDYKIVFKVKHGDDATKAKAVVDDNADYINEDIFKDAQDADNLMKITLPKSLDYYTNQVFAVDASVKKVAISSVKHTFDIVSGKADDKIRAGELLLKINNNFPAIKVIGGDGNNLYSDNNKTFNLGNANNIKIFDPSDTDSDPLDANYKWILYKDGAEVTGAWIHPSTTTSTFKKLSLYTSPSIRPAGVMIAQNATLASESKEEISKYTLTGSAKIDDGLGGIIEKTVEFNFQK